ncbi:MAG: hypothetical protein Q9160_003037 [Pyrenula sp. 1 TL-2023]
MTATPPPIQAPSAKEKKYDRQLRLWAASGQRALEESHILLIISPEGSGSSVAGVETLKNLVLPSIGQFTILDAATVTEADLGINFFLEAGSFGKSRAEESVRLLEELNPDVKGHAISQKLEKWIEPNCLAPYDLIFLGGPASDAGWQICDIARSQSKPLIYLYSVGFYSTFSVQLPGDFPIVDTHPDPESTQDLRLLAPWPELLAQVPSKIDDLDHHDHGHIPYILLLLYYLGIWKETHGKYPESFKEKSAFRDIVRGGTRYDNPDGGEENFDEAVAAVLKTITPPTIPSSVREVFARCPKDDSSFWIIASAVKTFCDRHGVLPLPGSLPDMKSRSVDYIKLQNIYKTKARQDVAEVTASVYSAEKGKNIRVVEIENFCKNAAHIKVIDGTSLPDIREKSTAQKVINGCGDDESLISIFLAFLAIEHASTSEGVLDQASKACGAPEKVVPERIDNAISELRRAGGGELHNIAAMTGGMIAQEAIKIITKQYVPVDNTCIFDGIKSKTEVFRL